MLGRWLALSAVSVIALHDTFRAGLRSRRSCLWRSSLASGVAAPLDLRKASAVSHAASPVRCISKRPSDVDEMVFI